MNSQKATNQRTTEEIINDSKTTIDLVDSHGGNYNDALTYERIKSRIIVFLASSQTS